MAENPDGQNQEECRLSMAAQAAEKQLRDQVMAAYSNEKVHEPVHHFAVEEVEDGPFSVRREGNDGADPRAFRPVSDANLDKHMGERRCHHAKRALRELDSRKGDAVPPVTVETAAKKLEGNVRRVGLAEMRNAARPPMQGKDLVFAWSVSPKMTRCDVDHVPVPRSQDDGESSSQGGDSKLWSTNIEVQKSPGAGLWMGLCQKEDCEGQATRTPRPSGLLTPAVDAGHSPRVPRSRDPRNCSKQGKKSLPLPLTPLSPHEELFTESVDRKLKEEIDRDKQIQEELHDGFVTQIYNYLSLGYPSLAHRFDDELSKISRISIEELRSDDERVDAKGYVGTPEGEGIGQDAVQDGKCARWTALKAYIHEWARQQPEMADRRPNEWGDRARRGSWAV